jgi:two-component system response regulator FlrC
MIDICFHTDAFPQTQALLTLLKARRLTIGELDSQQGCHTLLVAQPAPDQRASVEMGRKLSAKRVVIVETRPADFSVTESMGGRLVHVTMPAPQPDPNRDAAVMMLADLIAAPFGALVAAAPATSSLIDMARRLGGFNVNVFVNGPTGSGKEVLSRLIHDASPRSDKPFLAINCAAIPENMLEALLFGYEKGAFTGATTPNKGFIRAADGGTLLLDEISEMPIGLQAKLLRVLQEKVVTPLGSQTETAVDVRFLATSNRNMALEIAKGTFREDLFYRLNVFPLETLPLAQRPLDIPVLAQAMLGRHTPKGQPVPLLAPETCDLLKTHSWPGNVRELENVMQRALVLANGPLIRPEQIMLLTTASTLTPQPTAHAA